jgi:hypothetical protein
MADLTDRKVTAYRMEESTDRGTLRKVTATVRHAAVAAVRQVPAATDYIYRCQNSTCRHVFTRSVKH